MVEWVLKVCRTDVDLLTVSILRVLKVLNMYVLVVHLLRALIVFNLASLLVGHVLDKLVHPCFAFFLLLLVNLYLLEVVLQDEWLPLNSS